MITVTERLGDSQQLKQIATKEASPQAMDSAFASSQHMLEMASAEYAKRQKEADELWLHRCSRWLENATHGQAVLATRESNVTTVARSQKPRRLLWELTSPSVQPMPSAGGPWPEPLWTFPRPEPIPFDFAPEAEATPPYNVEGSLETVFALHAPLAQWEAAGADERAELMDDEYVASYARGDQIAGQLHAAIAAGYYGLLFYYPTLSQNQNMTVFDRATARFAHMFTLPPRQRHALTNVHVECDTPQPGELLSVECPFSTSVFADLSMIVVGNSPLPAQHVSRRFFEATLIRFSSDPHKPGQYGSSFNRITSLDCPIILNPSPWSVLAVQVQLEVGMVRLSSSPLMDGLFGAISAHNENSQFQISPWGLSNSAPRYDDAPPGAVKVPRITVTSQLFD